MKTKKYTEENIFYNNIEDIKKAGVDTTHLFTPEILVELKKCYTDCHYFIEKYCKIRTNDPDPITGSRIAPFILRDYQKQQVDLYLKYRFVALSYPRQSGKTTGTIAYFAWKLMFEKNFNIMCLANKDKNAVGIISGVIRIIKYLPMWMKEGVVKFNEHELIFENGSKIVAQATTLDAGRSESANIVYIDEAAFIQTNVWNEFYKGVYPTISAGNTTQVIMTSTPNGLNHWWKVYTGSSKVDENGIIIKKGASKFVLKEIKWNDVPWYKEDDGAIVYRNEQYKKETISNLPHGEKDWNSEYECRFSGSSDTLIKGDILERLVCCDPIEEKEILNSNYKLRIYEHPQPTFSYFLTLDVGEGISLDYTAINVIKIELNKWKQVATFYNNDIDVDNVPFVAAEVARMYNNAFVIGENNVFPHIYEVMIDQADYDNLYIHEDDRYGLRQTIATRSRGLKQLVNELESNRLEICDYDLIYEINRFTKKGKKYEAESGCHDDLLMSLQLFCWFISDEDRFKQYISPNMQFRKDIKRINVSDDLPFIGYDNGIKNSVYGSFNKKI